MRPVRVIPLAVLGLGVLHPGLPQATATSRSAEVHSILTRSPWKAESDQAFASFGISVGTAGDVNGDGYDDVIVGARYFDNGQAYEGRAYVYHGSAGGLSVTADWTAEPDQAFAFFGISVGTAGDVNGDGYDDVIVGAHRYGNGQDQEGRAYVFHGSVAGLSGVPNWTAESEQPLAAFGASVGSAADVNGDGYDEVMIGAPGYGDLRQGGAFVFDGSPGGLSATPSWTAASDQVDSDFGGWVGTAGDVNGDGYDDAIAGADQYDNGDLNEGRAFVYLGSAGGLSAAPGWTAESDQANAYFGRSVGTAGDVNGDGYDEVIVGADTYDNGQDAEGAVFVYHGSPEGPSDAPDWTAESDQAGANLGESVGVAGDVNGDGYADALVGADAFERGQRDEGAAFVFLGSVLGLSTSPSWRDDSDQSYAYFGGSVGTAGDVNGDGFAEVIVGAHKYDHGEADEGAAFVYPGTRLNVPVPPVW